MSLASGEVAVRCEVCILLIDAVVSQVHELVGQVLHGGRVSKYKNKHETAAG